MAIDLAFKASTFEREHLQGKVTNQRIKVKVWKRSFEGSPIDERPYAVFETLLYHKIA
jgi:hypothetical protein